MPGIVTQAVASTVLPAGLSSAFSEGYVWPVVENGPFPDGSYLRALQGAAVRRTWKLTRPLTASAFTALRVFWNARRGCLEAFYFYPVAAQHDPTGMSTSGRFLVRFDGSLTLTLQVGLDAADFALIELQ